MILLIAIAYTSATMHGHTIKRYVQKYVGRVRNMGVLNSGIEGLYRAIWTNLGQFHGPV